MRKDLNKQLCERERHGHDWHFRDVRHLRKVRGEDAEDVVGGRESMKHRHRLVDTKQFNENLNPLWGVVRKNVGRPWDKVYSEFCTVFDRRSVINQHILTHLFQVVATKTFERGGVIYVSSRRGFEQPLSSSNFEYYVHPRSGLLLKNPHYHTWRQERRKYEARRAAEKLLTHRVIDEFTELRCLDGVWYLIELKPTPREYTQKHVPFSHSKLNKTHVTRVANVYPDVFDVVERREVSFPYHTKYAVCKRTASHRELKKHGVIK